MANLALKSSLFDPQEKNDMARVEQVFITERIERPSYGYQTPFKVWTSDELMSDPFITLEDNSAEPEQISLDEHQSQ